MALTLHQDCADIECFYKEVTVLAMHVSVLCILLNEGSSLSQGHLRCC